MDKKTLSAVPKRQDFRHRALLSRTAGAAVEHRQLLEELLELLGIVRGKL